MRPLSLVRRNPLPVLGALVVAFAVWVISDSAPREPVGPTPEIAPGEVVTLEMSVPVAAPDAIEPLHLTPHGTAQALPKLKPGMTRTEVEGLVGAPVAGRISPATVQDGRITYHTQYEADLAPVATVRPIGRVRALPNPKPSAPRALVTLEFDATRPGHPLVGVHYPDPLF